MPRDIDPVDIRVGQRIRAYRLDRRMSQSALGDKIGVSFQQIQKYERGTNRVSAGMCNVGRSAIIPSASNAIVPSLTKVLK